MKRLLLSVAIVFATVATAQEASQEVTTKQKTKFGIKGGANLATLRFQEDEVPEDAMKTSFYAGVVVEIPIAKNWYFEPGLTYLNNGTKIEKEALGIAAESEITVSQINLPLTFKYRAGKYFFLKAGGYAGHISSIELKAKTLGRTETAKVDKDLYNNIDAGALLGLEFETSFGLFFEINANIGLTNIPKENMLFKEMKNTALQVGAGFKF